MIDVAAIQALTAPSPRLLKLYFLRALLTVVAWPVLMVPLYFRYHTLRYRFDDEGVHAQWGILFRREVSLTYARIQDIHLSSDLFERWLGLGTVRIQTAAGSAASELAIEGMERFEEIRDYLYLRMRGAQLTAPSTPTTTAGGGGASAVALLTEIRDDLRAVREHLQARPGPP